MALIQNSKPIKSIPPERLVLLWDLFTGNVSQMTIERYNKLRGSGATATSAFSDFNQRFYNLKDYPGQKIEMYHLRRGHMIEEMTLQLFQEIQKRNPVINTPVYQDGIKISEVFEPYKNYLATPEEVKNASTASTSKTMEQIIEEKVQAALENKSTPKAEQVHAPESIDEVSKAPKAGRRKKIITNDQNA